MVTITALAGRTATWKELLTRASLMLLGRHCPVDVAVTPPNVTLMVESTDGATSLSYVPE